MTGGYVGRRWPGEPAPAEEVQEKPKAVEVEKIPPTKPVKKPKAKR